MNSLKSINEELNIPESWRILNYDLICQKRDPQKTYIEDLATSWEKHKSKFTQEKFLGVVVFKLCKKSFEKYKQYTWSKDLSQFFKVFFTLSPFLTSNETRNLYKLVNHGRDVTLILPCIYLYTSKFLSEFKKQKDEPEGLRLVTWSIHEEMLKNSPHCRDFEDKNDIIFRRSAADVDLQYLLELKQEVDSFLAETYDVNFSVDKVQYYFHFPPGKEFWSLHMHVLVNREPGIYEYSTSVNLCELISHLEKNISLEEYFEDQCFIRRIIDNLSDGFEYRKILRNNNTDQAH